MRESSNYEITRWFSNFAPSCNGRWEWMGWQVHVWFLIRRSCSFVVWRSYLGPNRKWCNLHSEGEQYTDCWFAELSENFSPEFSINLRFIEERGSESIRADLKLSLPHRGHEYCWGCWVIEQYAFRGSYFQRLLLLRSERSIRSFAPYPRSLGIRQNICR